MEPLLFRNGNPRIISQVKKKKCVLVFQWSHFFSEMEIFGLICLMISIFWSRVSMEPLLFRNGNLLFFAGISIRDVWHVSMEPLLFRNGNDT